MHKTISKLIENLDLQNPEMKETRKGFADALVAPVPRNCKDHQVADSTASAHTAKVTILKSHLPAMPDYDSAHLSVPQRGRTQYGESGKTK